MNELLRDKLAREYQLTEMTYAIAHKKLKIFRVTNSYELLDTLDPEEFQKDERMPYWAEVWPASATLAAFISATDQFMGARCLELGAGVGVVSVAAALAGAKILATDYFSEALEFVQLNASANQVTVETLLLDWREIFLTEKFDYIFAADVLYEQRNHLPILQAIHQLLKPAGSVYISDPQRTIARKFTALATDHGFSLKTTTRSLAWDSQDLPIDIHVLSRKGS